MNTSSPVHADCKPLLYLDFDGVICYSLEECYQSSWLAWQGLALSPHSTPPGAPESPDRREAFLALRPFIRNGEDYLLAQELIVRGERVNSQGDFDAAVEKAGAGRMAAWKADLYQVRTFLSTHHLTFWASWNPLYPGMAGILGSLAQDSRAYILSTKKSPYVRAILQHHGIQWPASRTLEASGRSKLAIISDQPGPATTPAAAILIDDQVDHLDFKHPHITCYWALWGFVTPGAQAPDNRSLSLESALKFLGEWLAMDGN